MLVHVARLHFHGMYWRSVVAPPFHFTLSGVQLPALSTPRAAYTHLMFLALSAAGLALGMWPRLCASAFATAYAYFVLCERTMFNNHFYLYAIFAALLVLIGGPSRRASTLCWWQRALLRAQLALVYAYAAVAKLNEDWLVHGEPMATKLASESALHEPECAGPLTRCLRSPTRVVGRRRRRWARTTLATLQPNAANRHRAHVRVPRRQRRTGGSATPVGDARHEPHLPRRPSRRLRSAKTAAAAARPPAAREAGGGRGAPAGSCCSLCGRWCSRVSTRRRGPHQGAHAAVVALHGGVDAQLLQLFAAVDAPRRHLRDDTHAQPAPPGAPRWHRQAAAARSAAALAAGRLHALFSADARDIRSRRGREAPRLRGARRALEFDQRAAASALRRRSCGSQRCRGIRAQPSAVGAHAAPALRVARVARSIADAPHADSCGGSCRGHLRGRAGWVRMHAEELRGTALFPCAHCLCPSPARSASRRPRAPPSSRHPRGRGTGRPARAAPAAPAELPLGEAHRVRTTGSEPSCWAHVFGERPAASCFSRQNRDPRRSPRNSQYL